MESQPRKSFASDTHAGTHPAILDALLTANAGDAAAYGGDALTEQVTDRLRRITGAAEAYLVVGGTAANVLGLSLMLRPYEAVICAESAHLNEDEGGAIERVLGSKLLPVTAPDGKLTPDLIASRLDGRGNTRRAQPGVVELTQVTEVGTCYTLDELAEISEFCRRSDLLLHIDGARLANAAAHLDCPLSELTRLADVISLGGTKNGAMGVEVVLVMDPALAPAMPFQRIQLLQLVPKMRFLAAQAGALLDDDLWLRNARHANAMAQRLADGVLGVPGVKLAYPVQGNGVFAVLSPEQIAVLQRDWTFYVWAELGEQESIVRWMTAFDTTEADVDDFVTSIRDTAGGRGILAP